MTGRWPALPVMALCMIPCLGASMHVGAWRHDVDRSVFREVGSRPEYESVARLIRDGATDQGGGGTLIDPRWVLTAAHVVDRWSPGADYRWEWEGTSAGIEEVVMHPSYLGWPNLDARVDLALVRLDRAITSIEPAALHRAGNEKRLRAALVGFGTAQPANTLGGAGDQTPPGLKYAGFNVLDSVAPLHSFFDMDDPAGRWNALGEPTADSLEYLPLGGDSGGGVFVEIGERWELVAVVGTIAMDMAQLMDHGWYGQVMRLNRISPQLAWVRGVTGLEVGQGPAVGYDADAH